ncbi:DUF4331 family protein [Sphingomonas sp. ERG5]|uniref:DUF4331 family protein n=1 Tax=Sphingomonas sp. ERG5 TaxID=1381597 RepID=UPI00054B3797|nr:DUF4331 family protein [Sphingomonas sp. ERG5]
MRNKILAAAMMAAGAMMAGVAQASDHLDTPSVIADPRADISDFYAWTAPDGKRLNLVMTIVGHSFSDRLDYVFHIDSGPRFGKTVATTTIVCRFAAADAADCRIGSVDRALGDARSPQGLESGKRRFRVFAGLRDDPFFNNVKGTRAAYNKAVAEMKAGAVKDAAGCPQFSAAASRAILTEWNHTAGEPGSNFLAGWTPASIVLSVDLDLIAKGGKMLAMWASTASVARQIDRAGRPLTGNALLGTITAEEVQNALKEEYNAATPAGSTEFVPEIEQALGLYDGFDGRCGNQLLADAKAPPGRRYHAMAALLADDRLWVNAASHICTQLFAVERAALAGETALRDDCGGRDPNYDSVNVYRSLLVSGTPTGVDDGVHHDERTHSATVFPFLAAPDVGVAPKRKY